MACIFMVSSASFIEGVMEFWERTTSSKIEGKAALSVGVDFKISSKASPRGISARTLGRLVF